MLNTCIRLIQTFDTPIKHWFGGPNPTSMASCKTAVSPLLTHCLYYSLELRHRNDVGKCGHYTINTKPYNTLTVCIIPGIYWWYGFQALIWLHVFDLCYQQILRLSFLIGYGRALAVFSIKFRRTFIVALRTPALEKCQKTTVICN